MPTKEMIKDVEKHIQSLIKKGMVKVVGVDPITDEPKYKLTKKGKQVMELCNLEEGTIQ